MTKYVYVFSRLNYNICIFFSKYTVISPFIVVNSLKNVGIINRINVLVYI